MIADLKRDERAGRPPENDWPQKLAAPMPASSIRWRQDGKPEQKDGKWTCRVVAYIDADSVRERLDEVVPGEWDLTLEVLPAYTLHDKQGTATGTMFCVKAKLQVLGVIRENIGQSDKDPKAAATDAFKRAAARFGIGHELGTRLYKGIRAEVRDNSKYAQFVVDPNKLVADRRARLERSGGSSGASGANGGGAATPARQNGASAGRSSAPAAPPARAAASSSPRQEFYDHKREPAF